MLRSFLQQQRSILLAFLTFFLSVVVLGILTNLVSALLERAFGHTPKELLVLILALVLSALLLYLSTWLLGRETHKWLPLPREMQAQPRAALIALVGPGPGNLFISKPQDCPAAAAIRYHLGPGVLKQVWLLTSDAGVPVAEKLRELYEGQVPIHMVLPPIKDVLNIQATFEATNLMAKDLQKLGLPPEDVVADYTGGTSSMSVGLALAALQNGFSMEVLSHLKGSESVPMQTSLMGNWRLTRRGAR